MPRQLEIDKCGRAVLTNQQVRLFRKVIMDDSGAMHAPQQTCGALEIRGVRRTANVHRYALDVASRKTGRVMLDQRRNAIDALQSA